MIARDFTPQARLSQHLKDVPPDPRHRPERRPQTLPLSEIHRRLLERAASLGHADDDNSALITGLGE